MNFSSRDIIHFWFEDIDNKLWFNSTPELDAEIKARFEELFQAALKNELSEWQDTAEGCLALIIILDQFPLNMYRGKPESFAGEAKAIETAKIAVEKGFDQMLEKKHKAFMYMPFMHSEKLEDQDLSVELFEKAGLEHNLRFAKHHRDIIRTYGRFPHRNKILGRESSQSELDYLASDEAFLG